MADTAPRLMDVIDVVKPLLKPADWGGEEVVRARFADTPHAPVIGFAVDHGSMVQFINHNQIPEDQDYDELKKRAIANLENTLGEIKWEMTDIAENYSVPMAAFAGDYYCAEAILSERIMKRAHELLDSEILVATTPARGMLLALAIDPENPEDPAVPFMDAFSSMAADTYCGDPSAPITPALWVVRDGVIQGIQPPNEKVLEKAREGAKEAAASDIDSLNIRIGLRSVDEQTGKRQFVFLVDYHEENPSAITRLQSTLRKELEEHLVDVDCQVDEQVIVVVNTPAALAREAEKNFEEMLSMANDQIGGMMKPNYGNRALRFSLVMDVEAEASPEQADLIASAPFMIFYLVCAADGTIDKKEVNAFQEQCLTLQPVLATLSDNEVAESFKKRLGAIRETLHEVVQRFSSVEDGLGYLAEISAAIDGRCGELAVGVKCIFYRMGYDLAAASGGFLGLGPKVSKEEKQVLSLIANVFGVDENQAISTGKLK